VGQKRKRSADASSVSFRVIDSFRAQTNSRPPGFAVESRDWVKFKNPAGGSAGDDVFQFSRVL
jgi:hypothetical protein